MKSYILTSIVFLTSTACTASAILPVSVTGRTRLPLPVINAPHPGHGVLLQQNNHKHQNQRPIMGASNPGIGPNIVVPPSTAPDEDVNPPSKSKQNDPTSNLIVSDILSKTRSVNIFAGLTRDFEPVSTRLNDKSKNTTVLAPKNSAIQALPRKPWEDPEDYERFGEVDAYKGPEGEDRAQNNLRRFVEAHLVPASPWKEGEEIETLGGRKLSWTKDGDKLYIQPGNIEVDSVASQVSNGEVWIIKGVVNYQ
ncbi:hypothetical protein C8Q69DRAFT_453344 [Paecilomyces variotii]|uniref:FAS1 domain-containing protein n=1 Tax=Byssochlamys spectabilis TaxID=264951 RepID=A0A443I7E1_BYSSP|nr:hypothetical protein C8Q69DRAFT_453344 [Paecilomyces variotii]RWR00014.1 hypothetical protein C8Q69DRAFT_453344 [Paecilomyces variotii]